MTSRRSAGRIVVACPCAAALLAASALLLRFVCTYSCLSDREGGESERVGWVWRVVFAVTS